MGKITLLLPIMISLQLSANFQTACVECHTKEGIPTVELYKRYLSKYSSHRAIKEAMYHYLKNPTIKTSIMPEPFIKKFGIQKRTTLSDKELKSYINELVETYNLRKNLYIPTPQKQKRLNQPQ